MTAELIQLGPTAARQAAVFKYWTKEKPAVFITDLDGCLTDGTFAWTETGHKVTKSFGPDDADALKELAGIIRVIVVSADGHGALIGASRMEHSGIGFMLGSHNRLQFIEELGYAGEQVIYVGDGRSDVEAMEGVGFSFAPADAWPETAYAADHVLSCNGGHRAVAEAVVLTMRYLI